MKFQITNSKSQTNSNQPKNSKQIHFGIWNLNFIWKLEIGNWKFCRRPTPYGFTLVEMLVVVGIFSLIMVAVGGIILSGLRLERRVVSGNQVTEEARRDIQGLVRLLRFGAIDYSWYASQNINLIDPVATLVFFTSENKRIFLRRGFDSCFVRTDACLEMSVDNQASWLPVTARGVVVKDFVFYVGPAKDPFLQDQNGQFINPPVQPRVTIVGTMSVSGSRAGEEVVLPLQTTVSLRKYER